MQRLKLGMWAVGGFLALAVGVFAEDVEEKAIPPVGSDGVATKLAGTKAYAEDFAKGDRGDAWSAGEVNWTAKGQRPYLGKFKEDPVELKVKDLPEHKLVRVTFDLMTFDSWDGSNEIWGPQVWDMAMVEKIGDVKHERQMIHTTFSNAGFFTDNNEQAFPDSWPCRPHPAWTGSTEHGTLGVIHSWGGPDRTWDCGSVYHFSLCVPHTEKEVAFRMNCWMPRFRDKYWGVTNVRVETIKDLPAYTAEEMGAMWKDLASAEGTKFFKAEWDMVAGGEATVAFLKEHLKDSADATDKEVTEWVGQLNGDHADEAFGALVMQGWKGEHGIFKALATGKFDQAVQDKAQKVIALVEQYPETATEMRLYRTKQMLGVIGSAEAKALAKGIQGHPEKVVKGLKNPKFGHEDEDVP